MTFEQEVAELIFDTCLADMCRWKEAGNYSLRHMKYEDMRVQAAYLAGEFIVVRRVMDDENYMRLMCHWLNRRRGKAF